MRYEPGNVECIYLAFRPAHDVCACLPYAAKLPPWKDWAGWGGVAAQTALDNFVHYTFIYFPVFYIFKEFVQGAGNPIDALNKYKNNAWDDNKAIWALWIPCDMVIYSAPVWMRLPMNHLISLGWTMILSFMRGD